MTVTNVEKKPEELTMTITSEFAATPERIWQLWADPRQLEQWWGPPEYPATVFDHDLIPGGRVSYAMTGPDGESFPAWWDVLRVEPPALLEVKDGFTDEEGNPDNDMPTMIMRVSIDEVSPGTTRMTMLTTFPSTEAMEQVLEMGAEEGMTLALGQIEAVLTN